MTTPIVVEKDNPSISSPGQNPDRYARLPQTSAGMAGSGVAAESRQQTQAGNPSSARSVGYWLQRPLRAFSRLLAGPADVRAGPVPLRGGGRRGKKISGACQRLVSSSLKLCIFDQKFESDSANRMPQSCP